MKDLLISSFAIAGVVGLIIHMFQAQGPVVRQYWPTTIAEANKQWEHTHVQVSARVSVIHHEADGDIHLILIDASGTFIVAECIPLLPCPIPHVGDSVTVRGISRYDQEHKWPEVHPVERITIISKP